VRRGEIWWIDFGIPFGSEPGYRRPAIVVQTDALNKSAIGTVHIVPLTRTMAWSDAPGNVVFKPKTTGLKHASVANVSQLTVVDRRRLLEKIGDAPSTLMRELDSGIKLVLGLS
jgi:mRNA interferase MazF